MTQLPSYGISTRSDAVVSYLYLTGAMSISGSAVVVSKIMASTLPTFLATELGVVIGLFLLLPLTFLIRREPIETDIKTNRVFLLQALFGVVLYRVFTFWGLKFTSAANSGLITSAAPVLVAILAFFFLRERLSGRRISGIALVSAGLTAINLYPFISGDAGGLTSMRGNLFIFAAVFCEALFSVLSKAACRPVSALYRTTVITFYAFILLLPFAISDGLAFDWTALDRASVFCVLYYGGFVSFLSYVFWFKGIEKLPAGDAAVFTSVVPLSSIILSALILKEEISSIHVIGLVCIVIGIICSCRKGRRNHNDNILQDV